MGEGRQCVRYGDWVDYPCRDCICDVHRKPEMYLDHVRALLEDVERALNIVEHALRRIKNQEKGNEVSSVEHD